MAIDYDNNRAGAPSGIRLEDNRLHINNVSVESATAAGVLRRFPPDEWVGVLGRMIDHGAGALEAAYTNTTLQLVTRQLDVTVAQMQQVMTSTFTQGWATAAEALTKMLTAHEKALMTGVGRYLDGNSKTGLQAQMAEVFDKAGQTLFARVAKAFEEGDESALGRYLAKFSKEVQTGFAALAAQQAVKHHTETATTLGGVIYEEATFAAIVELARACGDVPEHCGATLGQLRKRNGDIVIGINGEVTRGMDLRLVYELKRRADGAQPFTVASIKGSLRLAKENRGAQAGIFLVEDVALLPAAGGGFIELGNHDFGTVYTPGGSTLGLAVAYRLARLTVLADALGGEDHGGIDLDAAQRTVIDIRQGMTRLEQIRTYHATAIGAINRAGMGIQDLVDTVLAGLRRLDDILRV
jgi:hypothetical protein